MGCLFIRKPAEFQLDRERDTKIGPGQALDSAIRISRDGVRPSILRFGRVYSSLPGKRDPLHIRSYQFQGGSSTACHRGENGVKLLVANEYRPPGR